MIKFLRELGLRRMTVGIENEKGTLRYTGIISHEVLCMFRLTSTVSRN